MPRWLTFVLVAAHSQSDWYMASANVHEVAKRKGFWDGKTPFDFAKA